MHRSDHDVRPRFALQIQYRSHPITSYAILPVPISITAVEEWLGSGKGRGGGRHGERNLWRTVHVQFVNPFLPFCDTVDGARYIRMQKKNVKEEESVEEEKSWLTGAG